MKPAIKLTCAGLGGLLGILSLVIGGLTIAFFDPFVDEIIYERMVLREGSDMMKNYVNPPVQPLLQVYFFNCTNPRDFLAGSKPILREVGPYVYKQEWERTNVTLHHNGTVSGALRKTYFFQRDLSAGPESDMVTIIDMPTVTAVWQVRFTPRFIQLIFSSMLEVLEKGPFATRNVSDFLWGYEDPLIKMAKDIMPPENRLPTDYFGFFYGTNGTAKTLLTQNAGSVDDMSNYLNVQRSNGVDKMDFWLSEECNKIHGSDGGGYHPYISRKDTLYLFNAALCRALPLVYQGDVETYGIKGYRFAPPKNIFDPPSRNPENQCYCVGGPPCMGGGVFNVSVCKFGSPTILSWPHFYNADQQYLDAVEGLTPDQEKHEFNMEVIPRTGLPLKANARMQINVQLTNVSEIKPADGLRPMVFPILWFQDGIPEMPDATQDQLRMSANLPEVMKISILSLSFVIGCALVVGGIIIVVSTICCKGESDDIAEAKRSRPPARPEMLHGHVNPSMDRSGEKD